MKSVTFCQCKRMCYTSRLSSISHCWQWFLEDTNLRYLIWIKVNLAYRGEITLPSINLSQESKERLARLVRVPFMRPLMFLAIKILIPRHRMGVAVVCVDAQNRILLLRHVFHPIAPWGLPGGWLSRGETPADCALRELKEETGLTADICQPLHVDRASQPGQIIIAFLASTNPGPFCLSSEIIDARWFRYDDLPKPMFDFECQAIRAATKVVNRQVKVEPITNE